MQTKHALSDREGPHTWCQKVLCGTRERSHMARAGLAISLGMILIGVAGLAGLIDDTTMLVILLVLLGFTVISLVHTYSRMSQ